MANGITGLLGSLGAGIDALGGGTPSVYGGLLSEEELRAAKSRAQNDALLKMANAFYAAGAPSRTPTAGTGQAIAQALASGREGYQGALQNQLQEKMNQQKIQQALAAQKRQADINALIQGAFQPAQAAQKPAMIGGAPYGMEKPATPARFDLQAIAPQLMQTAEGRAALGDLIGAQKSMQGETLTLAPDSTLVRMGLGGQPEVLATGTPKRTSDMQGYELAKSQGFKGTFMDYQTALKKAGASQVSVGGENTFFKGLGGGAADILKNQRQTAQSAVNTINIVKDTLPLLREGVFEGPFSAQEKLIARVAEKFGISGKTTEEKLKNTSAAMQNLAKLELQAAEAMRGQGQITENERALIRRASAGDLETMSSEEVKTLLLAMDKTSRYKIKNYQDYLGGIKGLKGSDYESIYQVATPEQLQIPVQFTMPNGSVVNFPSQKALDDFKREAGL